MNALRAPPRLFWLLLLICGQCVAATEPSPDEMANARKWTSAKFEGQPQSTTDVGYLLPRLKSGALEINLRQGHQLKIGDKPFERGIHCPSVGTVKVHLPAPAKQFRASIGVDSNDISYYSSLGRGDVTVVVEVDGREIYRSP